MIEAAMRDTITETEIDERVSDVEAAQAFDAMTQAALNNGNVVAFIATSQPDVIVPRYARLSLSSKMVSEFLWVFDEFLKEKRKEWNERDLQLIPYDGRSETDEHIVEWIYLPRHELLREELEPLENHVAELVTPNDMKNRKFTSKLRFYAAKADPWPPLEHPLVIYRRYTASKVLGTSLFGAIWDGNNVYDRVEQAVFLFDREIDCVQYGPWLFIFGQHNFHLDFKFEEAMREAAKQTLDRIRKKVPISNYDELLRDCQKPLTKLLKLRHISQQDYLDEITMEDIERVIADRSLPISVEKINGVKHVRYDPTDKWELLSLLDNDHVKAVLVERNYRSHSKSPLPDKKTK